MERLNEISARIEKLLDKRCDCIYSQLHATQRSVRREIDSLIAEAAHLEAMLAGV